MDLADLGAALDALRSEDTMPPRWLSGAAIFGAVVDRRASLARVNRRRTSRVRCQFRALVGVGGVFLLDRTDVRAAPRRLD